MSNGTGSRFAGHLRRPVPWWIPQIFLSPALSLFFLRFTLVSSIVITGFTIYDTSMGSLKEEGSRPYYMIDSVLPLVFGPLTLIHHLGTYVSHLVMQQPGSCTTSI